LSSANGAILIIGGLCCPTAILPTSTHHTDASTSNNVAAGYGYGMTVGAATASNWRLV